MEADLSRWYQIDYRDRWRLDDHGRPRLTLRRIAVLLRHLPADSAVAGIDRKGPAWTLEAHLLDDVRMSLTGTKKNPAKPHPLRPTARPAERRNPQRARKLADARRRARARRAAQADE